MSAPHRSIQHDTLFCGVPKRRYAKTICRTGTRMVGYQHAVVHAAASTRDASTMYCKWDKGTVAHVEAQLMAGEPLFLPLLPDLLLLLLLLLVGAELELGAHEPHFARQSQPH